MDTDAEREFRDYVAARQDALLRIAMVLTGHREDAEDLLQASLTKLALRWPALQRQGSPDAYVRKILYHQHISRWRMTRNRKEYATAELPERGSSGDLAGESALRIALAQALDRLSSKQRAVLVLRYYEDLPETDAAAILGCSVGTVRSQTHRALGRLRVLNPDLVALRETV